MEAQNKTTALILTVVFCLCVNSGKARGERVFYGILCDDPKWNLAIEATQEVADLSSQNAEFYHSLQGRSPVVQLDPDDTALDASQATCNLLSDNIIFAGVVAPFGGDSLRTVQAVTDLLDVPLLVAQPLPESTRSWTAVNLFPHYSAFTQAVIDLIRRKGWKSFTVIYEEPEGLERMSDVLAMNSVDEEFVISVRQLPDGGSYRSLLLVMKDSLAENFVVDCSTRSAGQFLQQAQQVGIISEPYAFIFTNPDLHTLDLDRYSYGGANITAFRIFDATSEDIINFTAALNETYQQKIPQLDNERESGALESDGEIILGFQPETLPSMLPLTYDAIKLLHKALNKEYFHLQPYFTMNCDAGIGLGFGSTLINHIRTMNMTDGLTGTISFDEEGDRSDVILEILELEESGILKKVGNWSGSSSVVLEREPQEVTQDDTDTMKNKTFTILISLTAPYGMRREATEKLEGNDRYEGFCVELIQELSAILGFQYTLLVQEDGKYGNCDPETKEWDGMIGKVMNGTVDFAITDLTITAEREGAVDFTTPFMNLGISILFRKPGDPSPDPYSFLQPFSNGVWFALGGAYLFCSFLLYLLGRICPDEWQNPYPCVEEPEALENQFTLANALWFNLGAVLLQGSEIAPVAYGTRALASMWWFFALIITSSYTANLATLLSVKRSYDIIHSVEDLVNNTDPDHNITFGAKTDGSTFSFFRGSNNPLYKEMYKIMADHPDLLSDSNDNGTLRVLSETEDYAFLMESTSIEYLVERNCKLKKIGGLLDNKGYGLAMKKESVYRQKLNLALLNLQEQGKLASMKKKWWMEKRGGGVCGESDDNPSDELHLVNVAGVFIVLVVGCLLGILVSFLDMIRHVYKRCRQEQLPFKDELKRELKFVFSFAATAKPLRPERSRSPTESNLALTLRSLPTPDRDSSSFRTERSVEAESPRESRRQSAKTSRQTSLRSRTGRRRSTIHDASTRLHRQSRRE